MKTVPFVLAFQHVPAVKSTDNKRAVGMGKETAGEEYDVEWVLCKANEVCTRSQV